MGVVRSVRPPFERTTSTCGEYVADGHDKYDPGCSACIEANSDAPEWTI